MATTEVSYDSKRIIPAPLVNITKQFVRSGNGEIIGSTFSIVVTGKLMAFKGSPKSDKTFWTLSDYPPDETVDVNSRLSSIQRKQEALRNLFSQDGLAFIIQSADGAQPVKFYPRIVGPIEFPGEIWFDYSDYVINLEADRLYPQTEDGAIGLITDGSETWNIDSDESAEGLNLPRTYRLTHTVTAVGKRTYDIGGLIQDAWKNAREFVIPKLGFDNTFLISSGVKDLPSYYGGYNHVRNENIDIKGGGYAVTETWLLASGTTLEDFSVETTKSTDVGTIQVAIQGNIVGLEQRDSNLGLITTKYTNANTKFSIASGLALTRAQTYSGYNLNIIPLEERVGRNPITGTINYSYNFDNRPSNLINGSKSEQITITDNYDESVIAIIPILGRAAGPILQNIGTKNAFSREVSINVIMPVPSFGGGSLSELQSAFFASRPTVVVSGIINAANPSNQGYSQVYQIQNNEIWLPKTGSYSRQITWTFEL